MLLITGGVGFIGSHLNKALLHSVFQFSGSRPGDSLVLRIRIMKKGMDSFGYLGGFAGNHK